MQYTEKLKQFPLFNSISDKDLEDFAGLLKVSKASAGENIITEGSTGADMYFLIDGSVDIIKTTVFGEKFVCASLDSAMHCVFGEMALSDSDPRSATDKASSP